MAATGGIREWNISPDRRSLPPRGRLGTGNDIARIAAFLACDDADWRTAGFNVVEDIPTDFPDSQRTVSACRQVI